MLRYILKRILQLIPTLILVSIIVFLMVRFIPGDPITLLYGVSESGGTSEEYLEAMRDMYGLNDPLAVQYFRWIGGFFKTRQHTQMQAEIQHQQHSQEERRDRHSNHRNHHDDVVTSLVVEGCCNDAAYDTQYGTHHRATKSQNQRIAISIAQFHQHSLMCQQRCAHVSLKEASDPTEVLHC